MINALDLPQELEDWNQHILKRAREEGLDFLTRFFTCCLTHISPR